MCHLSGQGAVNFCVRVLRAVYRRGSPRLHKIAGRRAAQAQRRRVEDVKTRIVLAADLGRCRSRRGASWHGRCPPAAPTSGRAATRPADRRGRRWGARAGGLLPRSPRLAPRVVRRRRAGRRGGRPARSRPARRDGRGDRDLHRPPPRGGGPRAPRDGHGAGPRTGAGPDGGACAAEARPFDRRCAFRPSRAPLRRAFRRRAARACGTAASTAAMSPDDRARSSSPAATL
jgi:hypothetical protein